jgi:hypothetical protein
MKSCESTEGHKGSFDGQESGIQQPQPQQQQQPQEGENSF